MKTCSKDQTLDVQLEKLSPCQKIFQEKVSGIDDNRPQLQECLRYVREGDTLMITKLDRLARSTLHLCQIAKQLDDKKVTLHILDQKIDTSTSAGRLLFNMLGVISQFETEIRAERQRDRIRQALAKGVVFGKPQKLSKEQQKELQAKRQQGVKIRELMAAYALSRASVYNYLKPKTHA